MTMESFVVIQLAADAALALVMGFLIFYLFRLERAARAKKGELEESMERVVLESRRAADDFIRLLEVNHRAFQELGADLDLKKKNLDDLLDRAEGVLKSQEETEVLRKGGEGREGSDPYERVVEMLKQGIPGPEVALRTGFPESEVDLIARLRVFNREGPDPCQK